MQTLDMVLQKRTFKAILLICALLFVALMLIISIPMMRHGWEGIALFVFMLITAVILGNSLRQFFYREVRLVVDSDGSTITFYNVNESGKIFNKTVIDDLSKLTRFYTVRTRTRYFMYNYSYAFEGTGWLSGKKVEPFPSLFEATEDDRNKVLAYVRIMHPDIELGYESAWSKLTKK